MNNKTSTSFLDRMRLWQKFALLAVFGIVLVTAPFTLYINESGKIIESTSREIQGLKPLKSLLEALKYSQQHRGMAMITLNGNKESEQKLAVIQDEANQAYNQLKSLIEKDISDENTLKIWGDVFNAWVDIRDKVNNHQIVPAESFQRHTSMITNLIRLKTFLMQDYSISYEPEAQGFYLIDIALNQAPALTELFGQARAVGSGILTKGSVTSNERTQLIVLLDRSKGLQIGISDSSESAARMFPHIFKSIDEPTRKASESAALAVEIAKKEIVDKLALSYSSTEYYNVFTNAINNQYLTINTSFDSLETVLNDRLSNLNKNRYILIAIIIIVSLIAGIIGFIIVRALLRQLGGEPSYTTSVLNEIAKGNLAVPVEIEEKDKTSLIYSMNQMRINLANIVGDVRKSADSIAIASDQIAAGNLNLSSRTDEQASSLQQTAATTEQLTATVRQNSENAQLANTLAATAAKTAAQGGSIVAELVQSMTEINEKSEQVENIINVIDSIAFQTNILALNAAVEAARAGEQGRGFAVVASEVRALAQRSASAAGEIKELIESSVQSTAKGNEQASLTGSTMQQIVDDINRVTDIMGEISAASREQTTGIEEINTAIAQMDDVTRQNATLVEESTAASTSMQDQSSKLVQLVSTFTLSENEKNRIIDITPRNKTFSRKLPAHTQVNKTQETKVAKISHKLDKPNIKKTAQNDLKPNDTKAYGSKSSAIDEWTDF